MTKLATLNSVCLVFVLASKLLAQEPTIDTYSQVSTDGTNVYATGVIQSSSWSTYETAYHTYTSNLALKSPSNRSNPCGYSTTDPSTQAVDLFCSTELPIDGEYGNWVLAGNDKAVCSVVGLFASFPVNYLITLKLCRTYFKNPVQNAYGCLYQNTACTSGTTPTCTGGWVINPQIGSTCSLYAYGNFVAASVAGGPYECLMVGVGGTATGPGPCN